MGGFVLKTGNLKYINDLVSVIMPAYNSSDYIKYAVDSVLLQTYGNLELIIYDDASKDNTLLIALESAERDSRIKIIKGKINSGVAIARNNAIKAANGRFLAFLDSDDIWKPEKLETQIKYINETNCDLCYASYDFIDSKGNPLKKKSAVIKEEADYKSLLRDNFIGLLTVLIDRAKTGEIEFSANRHEDLILWLYLTKKDCKLKGLNQPLAFYRVSGSSLSGNKLKAAKWRWDIYRKNEKLNILLSLWYMTIYIIKAIYKRLSA